MKSYIILGLFCLPLLSSFFLLTYIQTNNNSKNELARPVMGTIYLVIIIIFIIINFFIQPVLRVFSEYTEAVTTSLIPKDAILPKICTSIVGFSCTAWTKMRSLRAN